MRAIGFSPHEWRRVGLPTILEARTGRAAMVRKRTLHRPAATLIQAGEAAALRVAGAWGIDFGFVEQTPAAHLVGGGAASRAAGLPG